VLIINHCLFELVSVSQILMQEYFKVHIKVPEVKYFVNKLLVVTDMKDSLSMCLIPNFVLAILILNCNRFLCYFRLYFIQHLSNLTNEPTNSLLNLYTAKLLRVRILTLHLFAN